MRLSYRKLFRPRNVRRQGARSSPRKRADRGAPCVARRLLPERPETSMPRRRAQAGVTLVELAIVFGLIAFLAAMAVPNLAAYFRRQDARAQAQHVANMLSQARTLAMREGNLYLVLFDDTDGTFQIVDDDNSNCQVDAGELVKNVGLLPGMKGGVGVWTTGAPAAGTVPEDDDASIPSPGLTFPDDPVRSQPGIAFTTQGFPTNLPAAIPCTNNPGTPGLGQGTYYVTDNDQVVYAATLMPLGTTRVRIWRPGFGDWY
jgi:type II secretory pathway pseudopilin PulG